MALSGRISRRCYEHLRKLQQFLRRTQRSTCAYRRPGDLLLQKLVFQKSKEQGQETEDYQTEKGTNTMTKRSEYNRFEKERQAQINKQRQADYLKQSRQAEYEREQERELEKAKELVEDYKANTPATNREHPVQAHSPAAPDNRLGANRRGYKGTGRPPWA